MSIYLLQIQQLIALQKVDDEIHGIKIELEKAPQELNELRTRFNAISAQRERQLDKMTHLREQEKRLGIEIEDDSMKIKKSKSKLMMVGNAKEYHAMVREMDSLERINRDREEEKITLIEEVTLQSAALEEIEVSYAAIKSEMELCEAGLQARMDVAQQAFDTLMARRSETAKDIPMPIFVRYEFIRERLEHPVIVPVSEGICSGCHIAIPPQNFIELQKGTQILSCPNCQRLLFWTEHFKPDDTVVE